jgi:signal peptidase II
MVYLFMALAGAAVVTLDQLSKLWVVDNIQLYTQIPCIKGLFHLTNVRNFGAAFSSFQGQQWLFALVFALFTVGIVWEFATKKMGFTTFERWCVAAVYAGGLGNMIDRLRLGYVVDMIEVEFIDFPVFNIADCFITCGCIALMVHLVFFNRAFWKDEKR